MKRFGTMLLFGAVLGVGMMGTWDASAEALAASEKCGEVQVEPAPFLGELEPACRRWVDCPGEMLSVLDNISDLDACIKRVGANATVGIGDLSAVLHADSDTLDRWTQGLGGYVEAATKATALCQVYLGERNNPYFTYYPEAFREKHPEAFMRDAANQPIEIVSNPIRNVRNPVPAVDDPTIVRLASQFIVREARALREYPSIRAWTIGSEEAYPDYFALPLGDFREASLRHYGAFATLRGLPQPCDPQKIVTPDNTTAKAAWYLYREQAIADRASAYMRSFLEADQTRPVLYPTHGHPFAGDMRRKLGQPPSLIAGSCDGFEMGHIVINEDDERLNLLYLCNYTAFGVPVTVPRLGNKTLDATARGGGKSFTPAMLRRLVFECLGMGAWHIGPIHWRMILGDGEWAIKDTPAETECAAVFSEITRARPILSGMSRLQPTVGLYVSDDTWLKEWNPRWTAFIQDAFAAHWNVTIVNDALLSEELGQKVPVLISIDNARLSPEAREGLRAYSAGGGRVLAWGSLGTEDALGNPVTGLRQEGAIRCFHEPSSSNTQGRRIVNRFQTGEGAWEWPHTLSPLPFQQIAQAIHQTAKHVIVNPIEVLGPASDGVEIFTLTDGWALGAVVINHKNASCDVELEPALGLLPDTKTWKTVDMLAPQRVLPTEGRRTRITLSPHGTALLWIRPEVTRLEAQFSTDALAATVEQGRKDGADLANAESSLRTARQALAVPGLDAKAWCVAQGALASPRVTPEIAFEKDGGVRLTVKLADQMNKPITGARVSVRLVPDAFRRRPLAEHGDGLYGLSIAAHDMPCIYDFTKQKYVPIHGPMRVVVLARSPRGEAGTVLTVTVPGETGR